MRAYWPRAWLEEAGEGRWGRMRARVEVQTEWIVAVSFLNEQSCGAFMPRFLQGGREVLLHLLHRRHVLPLHLLQSLYHRPCRPVVVGGDGNISTRDRSTYESYDRWHLEDVPHLIPEPPALTKTSHDLCTCGLAANSGRVVCEH